MPTPLPALGTVLGVPGRLLGGVVHAGDIALREVLALRDAIHALPRLVVALEQLAPLSDSLTAITDTRKTLDDLARGSQHLAPALSQLRALHEQVVVLACDLRALEPEIQGFAQTTAALDRSIRVLADAVGPLQSTTERIGRIVDRLPDRRRRQAP